MLLVVVCVLESAGVGSNAGHCLLLAMCCGLGMVEFGSNGGVLCCLLQKMVLGCIVFYGDDCFGLVELAVGVTAWSVWLFYTAWVVW